VAVPKAASVAMPAYSAMLGEREIELTAAYVYALAHPGSAVPDSARADSSARDPSGHAPPPGGASR
jgi:mono/diheme cytochrome c family protein